MKTSTSSSRRPGLVTTLRTLAAAVSLAGSAALPSTALAQDFTAMINQQMAQMNAMLAQGQQGVNNIVAQRMRDPAVQAGYQQHVARARASGMQPWSFEQYAYNHAYTNGFSAQGTQAAMANERNVMSQQQAAFQALQRAQAERAAAQQALNNGFSRNQNEFGNQLMGNSTFFAPNGFSSVLPHTWQRNTYNQHNGNTYYVDFSGNYYAYSNGSWIPLRQR